MTKRGMMRMDRRAVLTGGAAVAGLAGAGMAHAAARSQVWGEEPLKGYSGSFPDKGDGMGATFIDAACGAADTVNMVLTAGAAEWCEPFFGMTAAQIERLFAHNADYGLRSLTRHGKDRFMAMFSADGPPAPEGYAVAESAEQYQARIVSMTRNGLEPVWVSVDNIDGAPRFTTVWRRSSTAWQARHGVKSADLSALTQAMQAKGMRPARFAPYLDGGQVRFAVLYRPAGKHGWQAWVGDDSPDVRGKAFVAQGHALLAATSYPEGGKQRWACIWHKAVGAPQDYIWGN